MKKGNNSIPAGFQPEINSNDLLESAEIVRASNAIVRMSEGIVGLCSQMVRSQVFSEDELKSLSADFNSVLSAYHRCYTSLMAAYSAALQAEQDNKNRDNELNKRDN